MFDSKLEKERPSTPPIPYKQKDGRRKDGTERPAKWKIRTQNQGCVPANQYLWWYYNGDIPTGYVPIFVDGNPLNNKKDNLTLLSYKELKSFVSKSNPYYLTRDGGMRKKAIDIIKTTTIINEIERRL